MTQLSRIGTLGCRKVATLLCTGRAKRAAVNELEHGFEGGRARVALREGIALVMKHIEALSLSLLVLGLSLGCQKSERDREPANTAGDAGESSADGGTAGLSGAAGDAGGQSDELSGRRGERGTSCNSTNDCQDDLSCIVTHDCPPDVACTSKSCQPSNFNLTGTGKTCHVSDCKTKADCCGDMPVQAPAKCANRESICNRSTLPGCTTSICATSASCGRGTCEGTCFYGSPVTDCTTAADCPANTCNLSVTPHSCTLTGADCTTNSCAKNTCYSPRCNCSNPEYDPSKPICSDPDCDGLCGFTCMNERCVTDTSCNSDIQCSTRTPYCSAGKCSECRTSRDCNDEECILGQCGPDCKSDTQCGLFETCQAGACVYVGCRSDRECVLQASNKNAALAQDPRLAKCNIEDDLGTCVFPCEIDAQCASTELCLDGICTYIGCETDSECTTIAGLHDLPLPTPERPWTTSAVCEAEHAPTP